MTRGREQQMSAGKGDRPRKVDGKKYRDNYDAIVWKHCGCPPDWDYSEGSKTKKQRMEALLYCMDQDIPNPETQ